MGTVLVHNAMGFHFHFLSKTLLWLFLYVFEMQTLVTVSTDAGWLVKSV